ncbi:MAG: phospholipase D-like domain-containing protein [Candidatus Woesebacteria bacterium]|jgi:cardiolipin synthase
MKLLNPEQYYNSLYNAICNAKKRIILASMVMYADDTTMSIFEQILKAAKSGVKVDLYVDSGFRHLLIGSYPYSPRKHRELLGKTIDMFARLADFGVAIHELRQVGLNPFKGRCHIKASVVDDQVFSFGGINFSGLSFKSTDYMLHKTDQQLAGKIADYLPKLKNKTMYDQVIKIDDINHILLDAGRTGCSVIYDKACLLSKKAKKIYYVSQMVPSGKLAKSIRSSDAVCYFNRASQGAGAIVLSLALDKAHARIKNSYKRSEYIHAKFILFELNDGSKALISGSHNFSWRGVAYGTQEIALYSKDETLWQQLYDFMQKNIV